MPRKPQPPPNADNPDQSRRFIDAAREVEADERPDAFDKAFGNVDWSSSKRRQPPAKPNPLPQRRKGA
jgi:hypothetical protein